MKKHLLLIFTIIIFCFCNNRSKNISSKVIIDPNTTSEMAQLMRDMTYTLENLKNKLESKEKIDKNLLKFDLIHEQNVTDSSFNKPHIKPMSNAFNYSINEFNKNPNISNYNAIINNCKSCHQLSCQGPLMKINKLSIETKIL